MGKTGMKISASQNMGILKGLKGIAKVAMTSRIKSTKKCSLRACVVRISNPTKWVSKFLPFSLALIPDTFNIYKNAFTSMQESEKDTSRDYKNTNRYCKLSRLSILMKASTDLRLKRSWR